MSDGQRRISINGVCDFIGETPVGQLSVVRRFADPKPEGIGRAGYYSNSRVAITKHAKGDFSQDQLAKRAFELDQQTFATQEPLARAKLQNNSRAIRQYASARGTQTYSYAPVVRASFIEHGIKVGTTPDIAYLEGGELILEKFDFSSAGISEDVAKFWAHMIQLGCTASDVQVLTSNIRITRVSDGTTVTLRQLNKRTVATIKATCLHIDALWARAA